jgi:hypothetical protein
MPSTTRANKGDVADLAQVVVVARRAASHGELAPRLAELALEAPALVDDLLQPGRDLAHRHLQRGRDVGQQATVGGERMPRGVAGGRLDAAHAGGDAGLGGDRDQADVAGARDVGAAAQLDRPAHLGAAVAAHGDDVDLVAVFFAEQRPRP